MTASIPARAASALSGSQFAHRIELLDGDAREAAILGEVEAGNIPAFLRHLVPVAVGSGSAASGAPDAVICVVPDYLAIGSDQDYFLAPMRLETALAIAQRFGFVLPTRKMVNAIHTQARVRLLPQPLPAGDQMRSTGYYWRHNLLVQQQRAASTVPLGALTDGDKKDLVLSTRLWTFSDRVAIYGWHQPDGPPIQPLSTVHGWRYADYSHGVRLVAATAYVDGRSQAIENLLEDSRTADLLSDEGPIARMAALVKTLRERWRPTDLLLSSAALVPAAGR